MSWISYQSFWIIIQLQNCYKILSFSYVIISILMPMMLSESAAVSIVSVPPNYTFDVPVLMFTDLYQLPPHMLSSLIGTCTLPKITYQVWFISTLCSIIKTINKNCTNIITITFCWLVHALQPKASISTFYWLYM